MEAEIRINKKGGYRLVYSTAIRRKGRILADITEPIKFVEDNDNGQLHIQVR